MRVRRIRRSLETPAAQALWMRIVDAISGDAPTARFYPRRQKNEARELCSNARQFARMAIVSLVLLGISYLETQAPRIVRRGPPPPRFADDLIRRSLYRQSFY
jgi:hypothetical protein